MQVFSVHKKVIFQETQRYFLASIANVRYSLAFHQSRGFLSALKGSFWYLLQQLRNSFADVKISKSGELIHLALSITIIVRFVDVKQSSFWPRSINLVYGNILLPFQQLQLGPQLAPAPLHAALVVHLEGFPLRIECSRQVKKVAVLTNCLLQACNVFDVKMIQIWTFPAAPSTDRVPSLAERVAYLRYSINL